MITNYIMRVVDKRKATYKLYPNATQAALLANLLRHHQQLYNAALQERADAWRLRRIAISYEDQCAGLTELRRDPAWRIASCSSEQVTLRRVKKAFEAFFRRCKAGKEPGYPRFKSLKRYSGFGYKGHGDGWRFTPGPDWKHGKLRLLGVGIIKARGRPRQGGKIKSCELMHKAGAWHLFLTLECDEIERTAGNAACGMDWGTASFLTLAHPDGSHEKIANPRLYRTQKPRELELERIRDRRKRGSKRRYRAVVRCARLKAKNARRRLDFHHKESAKLIKRFALVATEKLQIRNLTGTAKGTVDRPGKNVKQKAGLNREILDTAPARFLNLMRYKAAEARSLFMEAPTRKVRPSQTCPACGRIQKKTLKERIHSCADCGHTAAAPVPLAVVVFNQRRVPAIFAQLQQRVQPIRGRCRAVILQSAVKAARPLAASLDDLVGEIDDRWRDREAELLSGLEVDDEIELDRLLDRQIAGLSPLQDAAARSITTGGTGTTTTASVPEKTSGRSAPKAAAFSASTLRTFPRPSDRAAVSDSSKASFTLGFVRSTSALTVLTCGNAVRNSSRRLALSSACMRVKPVILPPGRARLAANPRSTGYIKTGFTIGMRPLPPSQTGGQFL